MEQVMDKNAQSSKINQGLPKAAPQAESFPTIRSVFTKRPPLSNISPVLLVIGLVVVIAGLGTGYLFARGSGIGPSRVQVAPGATVEEGGIGLEDEKTFRDEAEGTLEKGGIDGEGSHHLVRPGGPSQNVYLTSSVIDLDDFTGKKVHVWGETFSGQKAGWLMDVGRIKLIE